MIKKGNDENMAQGKRLQVEVYDYLRERILNHQMEDGVIYSETQVAKDIGFSRTPVSDALQKLEQDGFIEVLPSRGFKLRPITKESILKNNQVRCALEGYSVWTLAQNYQTLETIDIVENLYKLLDRQQDIVRQTKDVAEFAKCDSEFHMTIVESLGNEELVNLFHCHLYHIQKMAVKSLSQPGRMMDALREHLDICEALRTGDTTNVYQVTMKHLQITQKLDLENMVS